MPFFTPIRTLDELKRVVKLGSTTESIHLEFKQLYDRKPKDPKKEPKLEAARDIAQFANLDGGVILVGVSEIGDSGRPKVASEFEARVQNGRLVLDAPTDLPEGKVVALQTLDDDGLTDEERDEVLQAVDEGLADVKAGRTKPLSKILSRLRAQP